MKLGELRQRKCNSDRISADIDLFRCILLAHDLNVPHHEYEQMILEQEGLLQEEGQPRKNRYTSSALNFLKNVWYMKARADVIKYTTFERTLSILHQLNQSVANEKWMQIQHGWKPLTSQYSHWPVLIHFLARNPIDSLIDVEDEDTSGVKIAQFITKGGNNMRQTFRYVEVDSRLLCPETGQPRTHIINYMS